jgi:chemotaxis protein histidine kinase CheA
MEEITLNGFEVFEDFLPGANVPKKETQQTEQEEEVINPDIDAAGEELTDEELEALRNPKKDKEDDNSIKEDEKEDTPAKKKTGKNKEIEEDDNSAREDEGSTETEETDDDTNAVSAFFGVMAEKMGWELDEEDEVPSTPEELVDYFQSVIEENSVPQYASEEVEALDNFVKNGGNLRDYFEIDGELDLEEISIEDDEVNQKLVVKEFLKEKGFNAKQIEKKLSKYEDAGLLEDEAEDALEALKEIKEQKKQQLLKDQENQAKAAAKRQQEYFNSVVNEIKGMDDIRGIKIPEKDKKALLEYIFKPDAEGKTQY